MGKIVTAVVGGIFGASLGIGFFLDQHEELGVLVTMLVGIPMTAMFVVLGFFLAILVHEIRNDG